MGEIKTGLPGLRRGAVKLQAVLLAGNLISGAAYVAQGHEAQGVKRSCVEQECGRVALDAVMAERPVVVKEPKPPHHQTPKNQTEPRKVIPPSPSPKPTPKPVVHVARPHIAVRNNDPFAHLAGETGNDISWPQCDYKSLPPVSRFAIVGLNEIARGDQTNPCLPHEINWAKAVAPTDVMFYAFAVNPGPKSTIWPKTGETPYGGCRGGNTPACAYEAGRERATDDLEKRLYPAAQAAHFILKHGEMIWIDVEFNKKHTNFQQGSLAAQRNNVALIEGMAGVYQEAGFEAGVYSSPNYWDPITGGHISPRSNLHGLPEWQPTHGDSVVTACHFATLAGAGGRLELVQDQETINNEIFDTSTVCAR